MNTWYIILIVIGSVWVTLSTTIYLITTTIEWEKKTFLGWLGSMFFPIVIIWEFILSPLFEKKDDEFRGI